MSIRALLHVAEQLEREVDDLDDAALGTQDNLLDRLVAMRRRITRVRRVVVAHREIAAELSRPDFVPERARHGADALTAVAKRLGRAGEAVANAREMLIGTFDVHMTRTAQRTNDTMRILTLASRDRHDHLDQPLRHQPVGSGRADHGTFLIRAPQYNSGSPRRDRTRSRYAAWPRPLASPAAPPRRPPPRNPGS